MELNEAMEKRHSVRKYSDKPLGEDVSRALRDEISACNSESGLHIQLVENEPLAFDGFMAHYGNFIGVKNYIALVGKKDKDFDEKCGYYGERIVLKAQQLGLNTCWVALTYKKIKGAYEISKGEKLLAVISVGYGLRQGVPHKSKSENDVSNVSNDSPEWFKRGVKAALQAPTAMNQQKFFIEYDGEKVSAKAAVGFYTKLDLGIVKYHFEIGSGKKFFDFSNGN